MLESLYIESKIIKMKISKVKINKMNIFLHLFPEVNSLKILNFYNSFRFTKNNIEFPYPYSMLNFLIAKHLT